MSIVLFNDLAEKITGNPEKASQYQWLTDLKAHLGSKTAKKKEARGDRQPDSILERPQKLDLNAP